MEKVTEEAKEATLQSPAGPATSVKMMVLERAAKGRAAARGRGEDRWGRCCAREALSHRSVNGVFG